MSDNLDQYLASEAAQGLMIDQGEFSLDPEKALEKLSLFSLPEPGLWVVKMVQAAVASGAPEIRFTFERRKVKVKFRPAEDWDAEELLTQLLTAQSPKESSKRHLFSGILGAALGFSEEIAWMTQGKVVRVTKSGPSLEENPEAESFSFAARRPRRSALTSGLFSSPIRYLLRQTAQEYKSLISKTTACPIKIYVDGRLLGCSYQVTTTSLPPTKDYDSESSDGRKVLFAQIPVIGLGRRSLPYPIDSAPLDSVVNQDGAFESIRRPVPADGPVEAVVCVYGCLQRESRINFVMDGVTLQSSHLLTLDDPQLNAVRLALENGKDNFVLDVYVQVGWDDLDLTQMAVRQQTYRPILMSCLPEIVRALEDLRIRCERSPWALSTEPPEPRDAPGASMGAVLGAGFMSLFIPHAIILAGACGGFWLVSKAIEATGLTKPLVKRIEDYTHNKQTKELKARLDTVLSRFELILS